MGMFDYVNYKAACPACGAELPRSWQSKDGACSMEVVEPWQVGRFYTTCNGCSAWVMATVDAEVEHIVKRCDVVLTIDTDATASMRADRDARTKASPH